MAKGRKLQSAVPPAMAPAKAKDRPGMDLPVRDLPTMKVETLRAFAAAAGVDTKGGRRDLAWRLAEVGFFECPSCRSVERRMPGRCLYPTRKSTMTARLKLYLCCAHCGVQLRFWVDD